MIAKFINEMMGEDGSVRPHFREFATSLKRQSPEWLARKRAEAGLTFRRAGITFAVYGETPATTG